jgi:4-alpha-glucanotransferase
MERSGAAALVDQDGYPLTAGGLIEQGYRDALGEWHALSPATRVAITAAMGSEHGGATTRGQVWVKRAGEARAVPPGEVVLEDGTEVAVDEGPLPELPYGYHEYHPRSGNGPVRLIVGPGRCARPTSRHWGWAVQLYAVRSATSWGIGDLGDLRDLGQWATGLGAGFLLLNPLHAPLPTLPQQPSPYYPSSRRYRNPLYLRVEEVPGAAEIGVDLDRLTTAGRRLNHDRTIDRDVVYRLKMDALSQLWRRFSGASAFDRYRAGQGRALDQYAAFCVLVEQLGGDWRGWEESYRHPDSPAVARFAAAHVDRVAFHAWLQWLLDEQLARAAAALPLIQDLPVGFDPAGADAWVWQDALAPGISVGAPPDEFNPLGQDWGAPPFVPAKLTAASYEPFIQTVRATLRYAAGIRIDHVLGLFRLFWIPQGASPQDGAYVHYPVEDLLAILALESHRAGAFVIGEDLGTVGEGVRERLAEHGLLSSRIVWFEPTAPAEYPQPALAMISTHDLPTIAGIWTGRELEIQQALGLHPGRRSHEELRERLRAIAGVAGDAPVCEVIERAYQALASAPSALVAATLEDAFAVIEKPNAPGALAGYPSWSLALPVPLEEFPTAPLAAAIGRALGRQPAK